MPKASDKKELPKKVERRYAEVFQELGLSKNESRIYDTLLRNRELSIGEISTKSHVHRRNVYDSINRLLERGLVFEIIERSANRYRAVDPSKLRELIQEKERTLLTVLPDLQTLFSQEPHAQSVFIYRGTEGWKNYLRDILRVGEDFYCIGAKGGWMDKKVMVNFPSFIKEASRLGIAYFHLFDYEVKESNHDIVKYVGNKFKFLPKGYSAPASIDIFGDHVNIISNIHLGGVEEDMSFAVIVNERIADAFRIWFKLIWDLCPAE
jgi:sugar-specific transcriptional regulator TrmB